MNRKVITKAERTKISSRYVDEGYIIREDDIIFFVECDIYDDWLEVGKYVNEELTPDSDWLYTYWVDGKTVTYEDLIKIEEDLPEQYLNVKTYRSNAEVFGAEKILHIDTTMDGYIQHYLPEYREDSPEEEVCQDIRADLFADLHANFPLCTKYQLEDAVDTIMIGISAKVHDCWDSIPSVHDEEDV